GAGWGARFGGGGVCVPRPALADPGLVLAGIARAARAGLAGAGSPLEALAERFAGGAWLLILDNVEQVVEAGRDLAELLARCPGLAVLAPRPAALGGAAARGDARAPLRLAPRAPPAA